ncbi:gas vesicle protein GvpG [Streptomyces yaanensis]|uniref:Gas vesicle protein GvpG n=1 Tax=Streptomyces yaanensis TaxID=1142239 RepID=A0ABV7SBF4_9ACTN|nr:gas vesicle protein GvpG [Streptomyces sp. CGMCC 4.7035]WNB98889.1 gas vesicle protein GvpG [Streptomyces sp. CGMCC 4.7035]
MGLFTEVLLLPLAPVRGSLWAIRQALAEAERVYYDPATVRAELALLERRLGEGEITEEEFDREEDALLDRLDIAMGRISGTGDTSGTGDGTTS